MHGECLGPAVLGRNRERKMFKRAFRCAMTRAGRIQRIRTSNEDGRQIRSSKRHTVLMQPSGPSLTGLVLVGFAPYAQCILSHSS